MTKRNSPQILGDKALLNAMMAGQRLAGYAPASHWKTYESATLATLHSVDLNNFLRILNSFGNYIAPRRKRPNIFRRVISIA
jgi:hypothetical protein